MVDCRVLLKPQTKAVIKEFILTSKIFSNLYCIIYFTGKLQNYFEGTSTLSLNPFTSIIVTGFELGMLVETMWYVLLLLGATLISYFCCYN